MEENSTQNIEEDQDDPVSLKEHKWYVGKIGRAAAESLLSQQTTVGTFLVRDSDSTPGAFSLSMVKELTKDSCLISHHKIGCSQNRCWIASERKFISLASLVDFYSNNQENSIIRLVCPCPMGCEENDDYGQVGGLGRLEDDELGIAGDEAPLTSKRDVIIRDTSSSPTIFLVNREGGNGEDDNEDSSLLGKSPEDLVRIEGEEVANEEEEVVYVNSVKMTEKKQEIDVDVSNDDAEEPEEQGRIQGQSSDLSDAGVGEGDDVTEGLNEDDDVTHLKDDVIGDEKQPKEKELKARSVPTASPSHDVEIKERIRLNLTSDEYKREIKAEPWYFGNCGRNKATKLLNHYSHHGMFLIRDSDTKPGYSLSVYIRGTVKSVVHYVITIENSQCYLERNVRFFNLSAVISFYQANQFGTHRSKLTKPCPKQMPEAENRVYLHSIDPDAIALGKQLSTGPLQEVWEGLWENEVKVRILVLNDDKNSHKLPKCWKNHVEILGKLQHRNILNLYGLTNIHTRNQTYVITECMERGSLLENLQQNHLSSFLEKLHIAEQVVEAMLYIGARGIVLRNLQAINLLVSGKFECKIADFSAAEFLTDEKVVSVKDEKQKQNIAIKWTPPEAAMFGKFSVKSDVWSFGILLHEIFSNGSEPYKDMTALESLYQVKEGYRLPHESGQVSEAIYSLMLQCWKEKAEERLSFGRIRSFLRSFYTKIKVEVMVVNTHSLLSGFQF